MKTQLQRFEEKIVRTDGCWLWVGAKIPDGYGQLLWDGRLQLAHRVAYELAHGHPVPDGLETDHLCRVRNCVNPDHLEAVERRVNILRGIGPTAVNAAKTHCIHGHAFDEANTYVDTSGGRKCRACRRRIDRVRRPGKKRIAA